MADDERKKALRRAILGAIRQWTYDNDESTVTDLKGEDGGTYRVQDDLTDRIVAEVEKLDISKSN